LGLRFRQVRGGDDSALPDLARLIGGKLEGRGRELAIEDNQYCRANVFQGAAKGFAYCPKLPEWIRFAAFLVIGAFLSRIIGVLAHNLAKIGG